MGDIIRNTQFIDWLGEQRPFYGNFIQAVPDPSPTPTPSITPSNTPTPSITASNTPQPTTTPTQTTTQTPSPTPPAPDTGATAYLNAVVTAGGTVDATMSAATNTFFTTIRNAGILSKMITMYPFIGGTAAAHRINAVTPTGSVGIFNGGWTHNNMGCTPNGINSVMEPKFGSGGATVNPGNTSGFSHGVYINETVSTTNNGVAAGCYDGLLDLAQIGFETVGSLQSMSNTTFGSFVTITRDTRGGFYGASRLNNTQEVIQQNTSGFTATTTFALATIGYAIGARNSNGTTDKWSNKRLSFAFMAQNITGPEMSTLSNAVQTYQTSLSRQV